MLQLVWDKDVYATDVATVEKLRRNFFGSYKNKKLYLDVEEALFLMGFQGAICTKGRKEVSFNELASYYSKKDPRFFIKYNAFRDWRDRGLIAKRTEHVKLKGIQVAPKKYPMRPLVKRKVKANAVWYPDSLFSIIDNSGIGSRLFFDYWFGQYGVYKQDRGELLKLDYMETVFLSKYFGVEVTNANTGKKMTPKMIMKHVVDKREYAEQMYDVYEDWRLRGYVVKTGFKFGTHFRIYFPGASPRNDDKWIHSKHVLHIFPKNQKLLISEWARAVRVAHGVKKTFLLSVPEMKKNDYKDYPAEFYAYRRKKTNAGWLRETIKDAPRYLLVPVSEDEHIGGSELASLLKKAEKLGLEVLLSITDRETAITYYVLKKIKLPGSKYESYEIEWMKP